MISDSAGIPKQPRACESMRVIAREESHGSVWFCRNKLIGMGKGLYIDLSESGTASEGWKKEKI